MKIKIVRGTVAAKAVRKVGAVVDVDNAEGRFLIGIGKAVEIPATKGKEIEK